jgi:hypothetical protein
MLLQEAPRQYLLDLGYGDKAAQRLRVRTMDINGDPELTIC